MELLRLGISATQRRKLLAAGYTSLTSLNSTSSSTLSHDLKIPESEALKILQAASSHETSSSVTTPPRTAWDMLREEPLPRITTSCSDLDNILGGGICSKQVTEIGGAPGIGKTQLGMQLAVNVQIPCFFGGLEGKAVYVDTEGSFMVERFIQIAEAYIQDMMEYSKFIHKGLQASQVEMQSKDVLENVYYFRVCSYTEQIALINHLEKFVSEHQDVRLVIFDSITFHFRQDFDDLALRTRILSEMALKLMKLAQRSSLAVVLLNQVTTKFSGGIVQLTLALGDSWSHSCTNRIILYWYGNERKAYIDKSPSFPSTSAAYSITSRGIRNCSVPDCKRRKIV